MIREPQQSMRRHKLLTAETQRSLPKLYSQDGKGMAAIVHVKFFTPTGRGTWYITEGQPTEDGDWRLFGYCVSPLGSDCDEFGYVSFRELAEARVFNIMPAIERDCYFNGIGKTVADCLMMDGNV